jgi:hypothetical protein
MIKISPVLLVATYMLLVDLIALYLMTEKLLDPEAVEVYDGFNCDFLLLTHLSDFVFSFVPFVVTGVMLYLYI